MTPEERKAIAEIFRRLSRKENLSAVELRPAVRFLVNLKGFSKTENDVNRFFAHCFKWFCDKEERFAELPDAAVIYEVMDRFRVYMNDEQKANEPATEPCPECKGTGQDSEGRYVCQTCFGKGIIHRPSPSHPGQFPEIEDDEGNRLSDDDFAINGEQRKGYNVPSTSWKELAAETDYERARQKAESRRGLKSWLGFLRSEWSKWRKNGPANRYMAKILLSPKIKVIKETLKRKSPSKK